MPELTAEGRRKIEEVADATASASPRRRRCWRRWSPAAASQAQFNLPELGGMGQWSQGGMVMVGDMFNNALKARVDALCSELASWRQLQRARRLRAGERRRRRPGAVAGRAASLFVAGLGPGGDWWPAELGTPSSTGAQNDMRYAFFPAARRLAIAAGRHGDGLRHRRPPARRLLAAAVRRPLADFTSQHGLVRVARPRRRRAGERTADGRVDSGDAGRAAGRGRRPAPRGAPGRHPRQDRAARRPACARNPDRPGIRGEEDASFSAALTAQARAAAAAR